MNKNKESANDVAQRLATIIQGESVLSTPPDGYVSIEMVARRTGLSYRQTSNLLLNGYKAGKINRCRVRNATGHGEYWYSDASKSR